MFSKMIFLFVMNYNNYPSLDGLFGPHNHRSQNCLDDLDYKMLAAISNKKLEDLTTNDFRAIGFVRQTACEYEELYAIENLDHLKMYLTKENDHFYYRGYRLCMIKRILSTEELITEALLHWKLKMD
jgi:hypothetical protein